MIIHQQRLHEHHAQPFHSFSLFNSIELHIIIKTRNPNSPMRQGNPKEKWNQLEEHQDTIFPLLQSRKHKSHKSNRTRHRSHLHRSRTTSIQWRLRRRHSRHNGGVFIRSRNDHNTSHWDWDNGHVHDGSRDINNRRGRRADRGRDDDAGGRGRREYAAADIVLEADVLVEDGLGTFGADLAADADGFEFGADAGEVGGVAFGVCEGFEDDGLLEVDVSFCSG